jgi:predicted RNA binding protein YcfA (HicA-like mRNA interferase family)
MKREELLKALKKLAKKNGTQYEWDGTHGNGSHGFVIFGDKKTVIPKGELKKGTFHGILKQLDLKEEDIK